MRNAFKIAFRSTARIGLMALIGISLMSMGSIRSNLGIPAEQAFELGGENRRAYKVKAENQGPEVVKVWAVNENDQIEMEAEILPGETKVFRLQPKTTTVLINESKREAKIKAHISGDVKLGMSYRPVINLPYEQ